MIAVSERGAPELAVNVGRSAVRGPNAGRADFEEFYAAHVTWVRRVAWNLATSRRTLLGAAAAVAVLAAGACTAKPAGPAAAPSPTAAAAPSSPAPTLAPITQQDLANATLNLPSWSDGSGCPSGTVTLHNGQFGGSNTPSSQLLKAASVDLDRDGSADAVAIFSCNGGNPGLEMAVAFHRAPDGSIQTLGKVVTGIGTITDTRAGDAGTVQLQVSDLAGSDGVAATGQVKQWRTYKWDGTAFNQTAGSTSFTVSVPALTVTLSDLTFAAPVGGKRTGTMTVTLHNGATTTISDASVVYELTIGTVTAPKCDRVAADLPFTGQCPVQPIAPGATATVTFTMTGDPSVNAFPGTTPLQQMGENLIQIRVGDQKLATQPKLGELIVR